MWKPREKVISSSAVHNIKHLGCLSESYQSVWYQSFSTDSTAHRAQNRRTRFMKDHGSFFFPLSVGLVKNLCHNCFLCFCYSRNHRDVARFVHFIFLVWPLVFFFSYQRSPMLNHEYQSFSNNGLQFSGKYKLRNSWHPAEGQRNSSINFSVTPNSTAPSVWEWTLQIHLSTNQWAQPELHPCLHWPNCSLAPPIWPNATH